MSIGERFEKFFAAANGGHDPYPWQTALVERIANTGTWPAAITAPTGSGKSSVVDVHVFLVAERERQRQAGTPTMARPPRRLVLVAPRRVLVDDQHDRATRLADLLRRADSDGPLAEVRDALTSLLTSVELRDEDVPNPPSPLGVARLRGGVRLDVGWRLDPARCQIVCATPQMWGSRLLLRGFRSTRQARNLESGLLAHDTAVVIDEAHLHRRLVGTAQRIAALGRPPGSLQVVAMSATHAAPDGHSLTSADYEHDELAARVTASKSVVVDLVDDWPRDRAPRIVATAQALRAESDGTVGVFVNTVATALDVTERLKSDDDATVCVVCGRMRPADLERLRNDFDGLLAERGNPRVDFLVSTQSLEVGVDLDLGAMVSELAPASSLAQRAGRLNRRGRRPESTLVILAPAGLAASDPEDFTRTVRPYSPDELKSALRWLGELGGDGSPQRISASKLPEAPTTRVPDITSIELETLSMTSIELAAVPDVGFYVEDPVDFEERMVFVAARDDLEGLSERIVRATLEAAPPRAHELAAIPIGRTLDAVRAACPFTWTIRTDNGRLRADPTDPDASQRGDVLVVPSGSRVCVERVLGATRGPGEPIDDVVAERLDGGAPDVIVRLTGERVTDLAEIVAQDPVLATRVARRELADVVARSGHAALADRLRKHRRLGDLTVTWCSDDEDPKGDGLLVVVGSEREGREFQGIPTTHLVYVDEHSMAVADRAEEIVAALDGLVDTEHEDVVLAARLHDEGKCHPDFQRRMGPSPHGRPLAKPAPGHKPDPGDGWRHEQLSAGIAHAHHRRPLVTMLVGAHHGNGRPMFNRDHAAALAGWGECEPADVEALAELFGPRGRYEHDRAALQREYGVHRLAFLEALVRCADIQVSREVQD